MLISRTLRLFLDGLGRREEYEHYLELFQAEEGGCFAALAPDLASMEQSTELMVFDLNFLRKLELYPLVLLCGEEASAMAHHLLDYPETVLLRHAGSGEGLKGQARELVEQARAAGKVPVLVAGQVHLAEAVIQLAPEVFERVHLLRAQGGLRDRDGHLVWYHWLKGAQSGGVSPGEQDLLLAASRCLEACPSLHFAVGSPLNLLEELFTVRGAGSVIRRGSVLHHVQDPGAVDTGRLKGLLEDAFGRALADDGLLGRVSDFYLEEDYRGAALLEPHEAGHYLTKFAVGLQARGEGLALELWQAVTRRHPALFWRSRKGNAINAWYGRQADGRQQAGPWQIYWRGIAPVHLAGVIAYATERPEDLAPAE